MGVRLLSPVDNHPIWVDIKKMIHCTIQGITASE